LRQRTLKFRKFVLFYLIAFAPAVFAQSPDHGSNEEILRAIHQTTDLLATTRDAWVPHAYCYTCHHEGMQFRVDRVAAEHGLPVDRTEENDHLKKIMLRIHRKELPYFQTDQVVRGTQLTDPAFANGLVLTSFHDLGISRSLPLEAAAQRLSKLQKAEGYWVTTDERPPQASSRFTSTAYAIEAIKDYLPEQPAAEKHAVISKAKQWLLTSPPRDSEDKAMQLFGLRSAGASKREIDPIAKLLIGEQRQDGGWAQFKTRESDAYATGEILVALNEAGALRTSDPAYRRGVAYLLKTQATDGSWHVKTRLLSPAQISPPPFDFKLPYDDDYIVSYFGTAWADQALMLVLPRAPRPEKIYDAAKFETGITGEKLQPAWVETALFGTRVDLQQLLDNGLSANATTSGGTPLLQVVITDPDKVRLLLSRGADVNTRTADGYSALSVAANFRGTTEIVRLLLNHGATIERPEKDAKGKENLAVPLPLFLAAGAGEIETARLLLQHGDSLDSKVGRRTPLTFAIEMGDAKMVRFLIESGANIEGEDQQVDALVQTVLANNKDVLAVLIEKHFDVNAKDDLGMTPLHYAAMTCYGDTEIAHMLLAAGAKKDIKDNDGETPEQAAARLHLNQLASVLSSGAGSSDGTTTRH
jgi:ankyrin repeat protein